MLIQIKYTEEGNIDKLIVRFHDEKIIITHKNADLMNQVLILLNAVKALSHKLGNITTDHELKEVFFMHLSSEFDIMCSFSVEGEEGWFVQYLYFDKISENFSEEKQKIKLLFDQFQSEMI